MDEKNKNSLPVQEDNGAVQLDDGQLDANGGMYFYPGMSAAMVIAALQGQGIMVGGLAGLLSGCDTLGCPNTPCYQDKTNGKWYCSKCAQEMGLCPPATDNA